MPHLRRALELVPGGEKGAQYTDGTEPVQPFVAIHSKIPVHPGEMTLQTNDRVRIGDGHEPDLIPAVRELCLEYAHWLGVDLCFQGFEQELATLPGKYAPPAGAILLAWVDDSLAGCVALRPIEPGICEMKRLWVREAFRGLRLGEILGQAIVTRARETGYLRMRLDTLAQMKAAQSLYRRLGFAEIGPYYRNPLPGVVYLEKDLWNPLTAQKLKAL
jgi:ribosomal protein S18 acetylase RimI-like enzyme